MAVYHVSYDLRTPDHDYDALLDQIRASLGYAHLQGSTWLVYTPETASMLFDRLAPNIGTKGRLFVSRVQTDWAGLLTNDQIVWLRERV